MNDIYTGLIPLKLIKLIFSLAQFYEPEAFLLRIKLSFFKEKNFFYQS